MSNTSKNKGSKPQISIFDLARYFIWRSPKADKNQMTHLRLQKLCFYAEACFLAMFDRPLSGAKFQAWAHGPVSKPLWEEYKKYRWTPIDKTDVTKPELPAEVESFLKLFWDAFSGFSAFDLELMTHREEPWINARGDLQSAEPCSNVIDPDEMRLYYKRYIRNEEAQQ